MSTTTTPTTTNDIDLPEQLPSPLEEAKASSPSLQINNNHDMMISFPPSPPSSDDTSSIPLSFFSAFPDATTTTVSTSAVDVDAATGDDLNATTAILPSLLSMNTPLSSNDNASIVHPSQILNDLSSHMVIQHDDDDQNNNDASIEKNNNDENDDQDENQNKEKKTKTPVKTKQSRTRKAAKTKSAVITRAQKQQDVDSSSVNGDDADENGTNHHRRRSNTNKKKSNEDGSSSSSSSDNDEEGDNYNDEHDDDNDEHDDNENEHEHENEDDDNEENRLCVVCDQPRLQFNKVCYIGLKNVEQYKQCFPKYGGEFGRACQSCYNKFYVWKNQQKHGHKKCTCCSRELGKQSCSFKGYADIYREMFPDVDGSDDSRVCQSCYSKALKRKKDQSMADKKNKKKRRNSSSGSDDGSSTPRTKQNLSDTPPSRRRRGSSKTKSDGDTPTKKQKVHDQKSSQAETTMDKDDTDRKEITLTILVRLYDSSLQHEIKPPNATLSKSFQCSVEPTLLLKEILAVTYNFLGMDTDILKVTNTQPIKNVQLSSLLFKDKESGKHILCAINQKDDAQFQRFPLPDKSQISVDVYYEPAKEDH